MWTLQEIVFPYKAIVIGGKYEWQVDEFFSLVNFVHDNQGEEDLGGVSYGLQQCLKVAARRKLQFRGPPSSINVSENPIGLLEILRDARERDAGDKRDKVCAVLGLCKEEDFNGIVPNYEDPIVDVYTDVAKLILIKSLKPLRLLSAAGLGQQSIQDTILPLWVPDWSHRTALTAQLRSFEESGKFAAGGYLSPEMQYVRSRGGSSYLHLKGKIIAQLNNFIDINDSQFQSDWELKNYSNKSTKDKAVDIFAVMVFGSSAVDNEPRSLLQWFVMKCSEGYGREGEKETAEFDGLWKMMSRGLETDDDLGKKRRKRFKDYVFPPPRSKEDGGKSLVPFSHDLRVWTQSRKFYTGRSIGWVPLEAKRGDFICVFKGSELPHVLREAAGGTGFELIGHCYFQGIMHGEVAGGTEWSDVRLR